MSGAQDRAEVIKAIKKIPLLSTSAAKLLEITSNSDFDMDELIDVVKCDSALTARVLKVVNSAAFGLVNQISSIDRAISYLGTRTIVTVALEETAGPLFEKKLDGYESQRGDLWRHDLRSAIAAREVARRSKGDLPPDMAFTAGLLHDIGKAVLSDFLHGTCQDVLEEIEQHKISNYLQGEQDRLGIDHTEAGYELAQLWQLPEALKVSILHHHQPAEAPEEFRPLVFAVHLGDIITMMGGCGTGADSLQYQLDKNYVDYFDLAKDDLYLIMLTVEEEFAKLAQSFSDSKENSG